MLLTIIGVPVCNGIKYRFVFEQKIANYHRKASERGRKTFLYYVCLEGNKLIMSVELKAFI